MAFISDVEKGDESVLTPFTQLPRTSLSFSSFLSSSKSFLTLEWPTVKTKDGPPESIVKNPDQYERKLSSKSWFSLTGWFKGWSVDRPVIVRKCKPFSVAMLATANLLSARL